MSQRQQLLKRVFDVAASCILLVLALPIMAVVAILVRAALGTPVLFRQQRAGQAGRSFVLFKFRTMRDVTMLSGELLPDGERLTSFGKLLRSTSLDELPGLLNVLRGDMSLVGPRPLHVRYLDRYTDLQMRRHEVQPGITGWAQINGRNLVDWESRFEMDVWYVDHWSLSLDIRILLATVARVLKRSGVSPANDVTMPEFLGSRTPEIGS
jgi:sugar transferase EpsL